MKKKRARYIYIYIYREREKQRREREREEGRDEIEKELLTSFLQNHVACRTFTVSSTGTFHLQYIIIMSHFKKCIANDALDVANTAIS